MSTSAELDIGPLTWVKGEIDLSLERASEAINRHQQAGSDSSYLKAARTHLHQAHGALSVVGLDGVTQFTELLERLLEAAEEGRVDFLRAAAPAAHGAITAIRQYLDELVAGQAHQPLRLMPAFKGLAEALSEKPPSATELFFPDLSLRPPRREREAKALSASELDARAKAARLGFQRGLLKWLKAQDPRGLVEMRSSVAIIEMSQTQSAARAFWWVTMAFLDALKADALPMTTEVRGLLPRIDLQIKKLVEGSRTVAEKLMRDVLYFVAIAGPAGDHVAKVKAAYRLADLIPNLTGHQDRESKQPVIRAGRDLVAAAMEDWNQFCTGAAAALPQFHDRIRQLTNRVDQLGHADLSRLGRIIQSTADELRRAPLQHSETLGLEMATALLVMDNALEGFEKLGSEFANQVAMVGNRLDAALRGESLSAMDMPQLSAQAQQDQDKLVLGQVVKEILTSLGMVEQTLDAYFRDNSKQNELAALAKPLKQIDGALAMIGQPRAVEVLRECQSLIGEFGQPGHVPSQQAFEDVAGKLSAIGFFVEKLQFGPADLDAILQPKAEPAAPVVELEPALPSAEQELAAAKLAAQSLAHALREQPEDENLRGEMRETLTLVQENAQILADPDLAAHAGAAIAAIEAEQPHHLDQAVANITPPALPVESTPVAPSADAARLATASHAEVDAELLGIFIEEAHDVLAAIGGYLPQLSGHPGDKESLTNIRRAFHTLKGSGRMVGLVEAGEAGWAVEQVLNRWLQLEKPASPELLAMIRHAQQLFEQWVRQLEQNGSAVYDAASLFAACEALKGDTRGTKTTSQAGAGQASLAPPGEGRTDTGQSSASPISASPTSPLQQAHDAALVAPQAAPAQETLAQKTVGPAAPPSAVLTASEEPIEHSVVDTEKALPPAKTPVSSIRVGDIELSATLYELYINEAQGHIITLTRELSCAVPPRFELIRAAHTLAGISATAGFKAVHELAHALEMALNRLSNAGIGPTESQHLLLARTAGALEGMVGAIGNRREPMLEEELAKKLDELMPAVAIADELRLGDQTEALDTGNFIDQVSGEQALSGDVKVEAPETVEAADDLTVPTLTAEPIAEERLPGVADGSERRQLRLTDELDEQLLPIFLEESVDQMRDIGIGLRAWRDQPTNTGAADQLKRLLHTLKGGARMAGAMSIGEIVHGMESRIDQAQLNQAVTPVLFDSLDGSFDRVSMLMDKLHAGDTPSQTPQFVTPPSVATTAPADVSHTLTVSGQGELATSTDAPPVVAIAVPASTSAPELAASPMAVPANATRADSGETDPRAMLRVRADVVDKLVNEAGEIAIARGRIEGEVRLLKGALLELTENVIRLRNQLREIEIHAETRMQSTQASERDSHFDPLEFDRFTRFQELTRMMAESVSDVAASQQSMLHHVDHADAALTAQARLNREHSQALMSVRMVPFNTLADRLYRIVRITAKELGKRANIDIAGGQTELDRSILEKMIGPLEHLLRNAVAHGLETPERRLAAGKTEIGEIFLRVAQEGNEIVIHLADDGKGLDLNRIRSKAITTGLITGDQVVSDEELTQLIFRSGFSTADQLTEVAGRGVGMDVVKNETANVGGRITVKSESGKGCQFTILLPLTLAVTQTVLVRCGSRHYAIPGTMVAQVRELKQSAIAEIRSAGNAHWLGEEYPWRYLPQLLGDAAAVPEPARRHWLLLAHAGDRRVAMEVDDLIGNQEVVVKNIGPQLARVVGISGATVLGDGEIVLIINPIALLGREPSKPIAANVVLPHKAGTASTTSSSNASPTGGNAGIVMIVDDSLTVRKITGRLLAREGYHVIQAKDGVDALEQLLDVRPDVMLVDIEMPRMDGFDLTRNVRADPKLGLVPIIMITSRIADKHRHYAEEIGVNHYLGKPYNEEELLNLIRVYVNQNS